MCFASPSLLLEQLMELSCCYCQEVHLYFCGFDKSECLFCNQFLYRVNICTLQWFKLFFNKCWISDKLKLKTKTNCHSNPLWNKSHKEKISQALQNPNDLCHGYLWVVRCLCELIGICQNRCERWVTGSLLSQLELPQTSLRWSYCHYAGQSTDAL